MLIDVACYNDAEMLVAAGMDEDTDAGIELLTDNTEVMTTTNVKEKTFVITDELTMPASNLPIGEILKYKAALAPEDIKVVGSKLILRGTVSVFASVYNAGGRRCYSGRLFLGVFADH